MRNALTVLATGILVACTAQGMGVNKATAGVVQAGAAPFVIEHRVTSWGRTVNRSSLARDGWLSMEDLDLNSGEVKSSTRYKLTPAAHLAAIAALEPLRLHQPRHIDCADAPTDGPSGYFTWDGGNQYDIYYGCARHVPDLYAAENAYFDILKDPANVEAAD